MRGRALARELADQLCSLFGLRQCGRRLKLREHPSVYGQMGRCLSPCLGDLDPNLYRRRLDEALALFDDAHSARERLLGHIERRMAEASADRRYERAAVLRRRRERMETVLERLGGVIGAVHAAPRLVLAPHPVKPRHDFFLVVRGRVHDWGPLPGPSELSSRVASAAAEAGSRRPPDLRPEEVDEVRIVAAWIAEHDPPALGLESASDPRTLKRFLSPRE
jgi:DNA polymerase-3 subunit epsilon